MLPSFAVTASTSYAIERNRKIDKAPRRSASFQTDDRYCQLEIPVARPGYSEGCGCPIVLDQPVVSYASPFRAEREPSIPAEAIIVPAVPISPPGPGRLRTNA